MYGKKKLGLYAKIILTIEVLFMADWIDDLISNPKKKKRKKKRIRSKKRWKFKVNTNDIGTTTSTIDLISNPKKKKRKKKRVQKKSVFTAQNNLFKPFRINGSELKGFNFLRMRIFKEHGNELVYKKLLEYSNYVIEQYLDTSDSIEPDLSQSKIMNSPKQLTLDGTFIKEYIVRTEVGEDIFLDVLKNRVKHGYKFILYILICKLESLKDLPYIGYTKNMKKRFRDHIMNGIGPHGKGYAYVNVVPLHQAIIKMIKLNLNLIEKKIQQISNDKGVVIGNKDDLYCWLENHLKRPEYHQVMDFLVTDIFLQFFESNELELHKKRQIVKDRERGYTEKYKNINNRNVIGTIWPNGLNAVSGGSGGSYIYVPLLDVAALSTLGLKLKNISKLLSKLNKKRMSPDLISRRISAEFANFEALQEIFLKPVVASLIKSKHDFKFEDISKALKIPKRTLHRRIKKWFNTSYSFLKLLAKQNKLDWTKNFERDNRNLRGFPLSQWKTWAIEEISTRVIGDIVKCNKKTIGNTFKELSYRLVGINNLGLRQIRKILRKNKAKKLLQKGNHPKDIMESSFKMSPGESNWRRFFKNLFDMPYDEILNDYSIENAEFKEGTKISTIYDLFKEKPNKKYTSKEIAQLITGLNKKKT